MIKSSTNDFVLISRFHKPSLKQRHKSSERAITFTSWLIVIEIVGYFQTADDCI